MRDTSDQLVTYQYYPNRLCITKIIGIIQVSLGIIYMNIQKKQYHTRLSSTDTPSSFPQKTTPEW